MRSLTSHKENRLKGILQSRAPTMAQRTYLPRRRTRLLLTRILRSMCCSMADFVSYGFLSEYCPTSKDRADLSTTANCTSVEMRLRKKVLEVTSRGISPKRMRMAEVNRISVPKTLAISEDYP